MFHAVSAFNNAGFALYSDNLIGFVDDAWIMFPICLAVIAGGIGFPVLFELRRRWRTPRQWTVHTRLTVYGPLAAAGRRHRRVPRPGVDQRRDPRPADTWGKIVGGVTGA